jgi:cytochrome c oxidase assembly protein subunit 15
MHPALHRLALIAAAVSFAVILLGAFVRLSDAGLGCPDWPGCYGHLTWPDESHEIRRANEAFPERAVESHKAWKEMVHRYLAGALVLLVLAINALAWKSRSTGRVRMLAAALLALILFQAALGMWTVTLKLLPVVVMGHLLGGLTTFSLLLWIAWTTAPRRRTENTRAFQRWRPLILAAFAVIVAQIALGGWTSANYAALACPDFPTCHGQIWPEANFREGFVLWREVGVDYEGGVLDLRSRIAIHQTHRLGALVVLSVVGVLSLLLIMDRRSRSEGLVLGALLLTQLVLGIQNIVLQLPLANAVAHNGVATLLLAATLWVLHRSANRRY